MHGWAISEQVGHRKPEPEIFQAAANTVNASLRGAWMIGHSANADIAGAHRLGIASVWLSAGQPWNELSYHPTHIADDIASAIRHVTTADSKPHILNSSDAVV